ncbi:hypothetical protein [Methanosphaera sp.]
MVKEKDIIIRSNGEGQIFSVDPNDPEHRYSLPIHAILEQHYSYILDDMNKNNFKIPSDEECMIFKEVVHIDKVVGFSTYKGGDANEHKTLTLQYIYVIPEYRGNNLLVKDVIDTISLDRYVSIESPTRFMVESLINGGLAQSFDNRYVISRVPFCAPIRTFSDEEKEYLKQEYNIPDPTGINRESSLYDLKYCAVVCPAFDGSNRAHNPEDSTTNSLEDGYISELLEIDDEFFNASQERESDGELYTDAYFERVSKTIAKYNDEINELLS